MITKPINNGHVAYEIDNIKYTPLGVKVICSKDLDKIDNEFCLSLFQEYVEKRYEIRVFFIEDKLFPMAIFSQGNSKTKYDYRNYDRTKPNRNVPYVLSENVSKSILQFIQKSNLTTGSIDLIKSSDSNYYFLEVNPAGQFGWLSANCNYYIEKYIAKHLISK